MKLALRGLAVAVFFSTALGCPAAAAGVVEIRSVGIANAQVDEGETAIIDLLFFNDSGETIFKPTPLRVVNAIDFDGGDMADEAFDTRIANNLCANVLQLLDGVGCRFDLEVLTRGVDPNDLPDHGDWKVRVSGVYDYLDPVTQEIKSDFTGLSGIFVRVFDPSPMPEPGSAALLLLGLAAAGARGRLTCGSRPTR